MRPFAAVRRRATSVLLWKTWQLKVVLKPAVYFHRSSILYTHIFHGRGEGAGAYPSMLGERNREDPCASAKTDPTFMGFSLILTCENTNTGAPETHILQSIHCIKTYIL